MGAKKKIKHLLSTWVGNARDDDVSLFLQIFREYFHGFRHTYFAIFGLIAIAALATGAAAWLVKDVVNSVFVDRKSSLLLPLVAVVLVVFVLKGISTYWQTVLANRISNAMVADIQKRLIDHVLSQKVRFFSTNPSDDLVMRFNQGAQSFNSILNIVLVKGVRDLATLCVLIAVMLIQDPILTIVSFAVAPIVFYGISSLVRRLKKLAEQELSGFGELNRLVRETVQGITVVKAYNLEDQQRENAHAVVDAIRNRRDRMAALQAAPIPMLDSVGGIAVALAILYAGTRMTYGGGYDTGTFASFLTALLLAADPARRLSQMRVSLRRAFAGVRAVFELLNNSDAEPSGVATHGLTGDAVAPSATPDHRPALAFKGIRFSYDGTSNTLDGIDLEVAQGEFVALVGPSGAGKSTIIKLPLKLYEVADGVVEVFGRDVSDWDTHSLRTSISYVGQNNFLFSGSVRENLVMSASGIQQERVEEACQAVGLHRVISGLPHGYDTGVGELGSLVSGGQAQRLNMARAIIRDAPILLLDEVTSALDSENEMLIRDYVASQQGLKTILIIAHRLSTVKDADRIAIVQDGQITDEGHHNELFRRNKYYNSLVSLQFAA